LNHFREADLMPVGSGYYPVPKGWPRSANWLWKRIQEIRPNCERAGIHVGSHDTNTGRVIYLSKTTVTTDTAITPDTHAGDSNPSDGDGSRAEDGPGVTQEHVQNDGSDSNHGTPEELGLF